MLLTSEIRSRRAASSLGNAMLPRDRSESLRNDRASI